MVTLDTLAATVAPVSTDRIEDATGGIFIELVLYWLGYNVGRGW